MTEGKFRHVPVVDQGRLIGIVSIGDVVKHRLQEMERELGGDARLHPDRVGARNAGGAGAFLTGLCRAIVSA